MLKITVLILILTLKIFLQNINALGCMKTICSNDARNFQNQIRPCSLDGYCGDYKSLRNNNQFLEAVDLSCNKGNYVYAPFDGELSYYQPFNGLSSAECANQGARIEGLGQWRGYYVLISTIKLYKLGGKVRAGDKLGVADNIECFNPTSKNFKNYLRVELFRNGRPINPTYHLIDCMCVGQLCESNSHNSIIGEPFKYDSKFNGVRGWELKCSPFLESDTNTYKTIYRMPKIYSPIEGNVIGRIRLNYLGGIYTECDNEGLFIIGTGKWTDYEVRIFNIRFLEELGLGNKHIEQGQHIGTRLSCKSSTDSIFIEVRFQGVLVDISESISAKSCQHKKLNQIF